MINCHLGVNNNFCNYSQLIINDLSFNNSHTANSPLLFQANI